MINILGETYILATRMEVRGVAVQPELHGDRKRVKHEEAKCSQSIFKQIRAWFSSPLLSVS
ncbi:hypothetical protein [Kiloniella sp.]|uniref:hypothetical protein n=1 Tax=Kiloniella sp. TaxID=1938587 RepID=UPI003B019D88